MVPHSQTDLPTDSRALVEDYLREFYGRIIYSHKTHEKCADILLSRLSRIKLFQIILSSMTTVGFVTVIISANPDWAIIGMAISALLLALNLYTRDRDLSDLAQKHRQVAVELWLYREQCLTLITDLRIGKESVENITKRRDTILEKLYSVYSGAPDTTPAAYKRAQKAIQQQEEMSFSDEEIDALLPGELKKAYFNQKREGEES